MLFNIQHVLTVEYRGSTVLMGYYYNKERPSTFWKKYKPAHWCKVFEGEISEPEEDETRYIRWGDHPRVMIRPRVVITLLDKQELIKYFLTEQQAQKYYQHLLVSIPDLKELDS